jgi:YjjG family noncanonical pyrimidine nucleotidase
MARYQHLFFDLDRTLWDFDTNSQEALREIVVECELEGRGITDSGQFLDKYRDINLHYWSLYREQKIDKETLRWIRFGKTLEHFGIHDQKLAMQLAQLYVSVSPLKTGLMPGTLDALEYLGEKYRMHIITNGFEEVQHIKLKQSGLDRFFDIVVTSEGAGHKKPRPEIFAYACQASGATYSDSIMIGDDLEADILGAQNAGMDHVFYNPEGAAHSYQVTHEISALVELKSLL